MTTDGRRECSLSSDVRLRWGAGFCEQTKEALKREVAHTEVELRVEGSVLSNSLVYERYEHYDRENRPHCHTWLVKLSRWVPGALVSLFVTVRQYGTVQYRESLQVRVRHVSA